MNEINLSLAESEPVAKVLECAREGSWVLICPIQFPQYFTKLYERLQEMRKAGECHKDFRVFFDLQGLTQNEIPDNFLFEQCITLHLDGNNVDALPTFDDIWTKVLDPDYLKVLTDLAEDQAPVRDIELYTQWGPEEGKAAANVKFLFEKDNANVQMIESFKQLAYHKKTEFDELLELQAEQTRRELEKQRAAEERAE